MNSVTTQSLRILASIVGSVVVGCDVPPTPPEVDTEVSVTADDGTLEGGSSSGGEIGDFSDEEIATILTWLGPLPASPLPDPSNAHADDPDAAALGQKLFFEPRYSANGQISCATCHDPASGFSDARANTSAGLAFTGRASMSVLNGAYGASAEATMAWQFWDGRCDSQWSQALGPPESAVEMGSSRTTVALLLFDEYRPEYEAVFGSMPALRDAEGVAIAPESAMPGTPEWDALPESVQNDIDGVYANFGKAIAAYERLLISRNSRFDLFWNDLAKGVEHSDALSEEEREGLRVFIGAGRCLGCHGGPNFTDGQFHNIAVPQTGDNVPTSDPGRATGVDKVMADSFNCSGPHSDHPDKAACGVSALSADGGELGAFKTPSLRSTGATAPYMHTGDFASLDEVVRHYDIGGAPAGTFDGVRDELLRPLELSKPEREALVAFLLALEGEPLDPALLESPQ